MELILKSENKNKLAAVIALAKKLNISVEEREEQLQQTDRRNELVNRILNFKAKRPGSIKDAAKWEREQRGNRDLPFTNDR